MHTGVGLRQHNMLTGVWSNAAHASQITLVAILCAQNVGVGGIPCDF